MSQVKDDPDGMEDEVISWLASQPTSSLEQVYSVITLDLPEAAKGKRKTLLNSLLKHLCDIETGDDDAGLSTILLLHEHLQEDKQPVTENKTAISESGVKNKIPDTKLLFLIFLYRKWSQEESMISLS